MRQAVKTGSIRITTHQQETTRLRLLARQSKIQGWNLRAAGLLGGRCPENDRSLVARGDVDVSKARLQRRHGVRAGTCGRLGISRVGRHRLRANARGSKVAAMWEGGVALHCSGGVWDVADPTQRGGGFRGRGRHVLGVVIQGRGRGQRRRKHHCGTTGRAGCAAFSRRRVLAFGRRDGRCSKIERAQLGPVARLQSLSEMGRG